MASTRLYRDRVLGRLLPFGPVQARSMFGGFGLFCDGIMFALIADDRLFFKTGVANRGDFEAAGSAPFVYESRGRRVEMSYWHVPAAVFDDPTRLVQWAAKAQAAAQRRRAPGPVHKGRRSRK